MRKALLAKFAQHEDLKKILLNTQGSNIIEHNPAGKLRWSYVVA